MSSITDEGRKRALDEYGIRLLPSPSDRSHLTAASVAFGPFTVGDYVTISMNKDSYIATGSAVAEATTSDVFLPAGVHDFVIPSGVTHVAVISAESDASAAVWSS
ncbi:MAG: hypothetical protein GY700_01605 [Propionibacteriaceae bacterium]|nr:hypothetical protein [Propionibacteriaceae bacterium]